MEKQSKTRNCRCRLCGELFFDNEMSEEHYPARSTGNNDIVKINLMDIFDPVKGKTMLEKVQKRCADGEELLDAISKVFDDDYAIPAYPKGRTARTLCKRCNTFLGVYDAAYLRFFSVGGDPQKVKGYQQQTKLQIIKALYAKFLSIPEALHEEFDFIDFIKDPNKSEYSGKWRLYFVKRTLESETLFFGDIGTGKATFDEGVVYELADNKFIFNLLNFEKHADYPMTDIFDILHKSYSIVEGLGENGGYHAGIIIPRLLSDLGKEQI